MRQSLFVRDNDLIRNYFLLTKPGIIFSNLLTAGAGFFLGSSNEVNHQLLIFMLSGLGLIIASSAVFNNYLDREIDKRMERTKSRALVKGIISTQSALIFATILGIIGV